MEFSGTRKLIFDASIRLFASKGYEEVSIRDIADAVGIKPASIYNHFTSKDEILETIYQYYKEGRLNNRSNEDKLKYVIQTGNAREVVDALNDSAFEFDEETSVRLILTMKIMLMRMYMDHRVNDFFLHDMYKTDMAYMRKWLSYAQDIGRLDKEFDIDTFSSLFWKQLMMMGIWAFADPDYQVRQLDEEFQLVEMFSRILPLKDPVGGLK